MSKGKNISSDAYPDKSQYFSVKSSGNLKEGQISSDESAESQDSNKCEQGKFQYTLNYTQEHTINCNEEEEESHIDEHAFKSFANNYPDTKAIVNTSNFQQEWRATNKRYDTTKSTNFASFYQHHVNVSVWANHLRLNYILKILMIIALLLNTALLSWTTNKYKEQLGEFRVNVSPVFISVNGKWYFMSESLNCREVDFCKSYCAISTGILIASLIQCLSILCTLFVYLISLVISKKNVDRLNWLGLLAGLLAWATVVLINNNISNLTIGFYVMVALVALSLLLQLHYIYCSKKIREKILINQLLEA